MQIAKETGTQLHAWDEDEAIIDPDGENLSQEEAKEYSTLLWDDGVIADAFRYSNEHYNDIDPQRSLHDFFAEKAEGFFLDQPEQAARRKREIFLLVARMWGAYIGMYIVKIPDTDGLEAHQRLQIALRVWKARC